MRDLDYVEKRIIEIEKEVTRLQVQSDGTIGCTTKDDFLRLKVLKDEYEDLTEGENVLMFNPSGVMEPLYVVHPEAGQQYENYWASELENVLSSLTTYKDVLPCFKRNGKADTRFYVNKYKCVKIYTDGTSGTNHAVGLYGMSPAHSGGGFSVSYTGSISAIDAVNAGTPPSSFPDSFSDFIKKKHMITWDEYAFLCLLATKYRFNPYGDTSRGADTLGNLGEPAEYFYNSSSEGYDEYPHTKTGTGPRSWRHNGKFTGIADLVGGVRTIIAGVRVSSGIIEAIDFTETDGTLSASDVGTDSTLWRAISTEDGSFIDPSTVDGNTVKAYCIDMASELTNYAGAHVISDEITIRSGDYYTNEYNYNITWKEGLRKDKTVQLLGYAPFSGDFNLSGGQYLKNNDGSIWTNIAGGYWYNGPYAGLRCVGGSVVFSGTHSTVGLLLASRD